MKIILLILAFMVVPVLAQEAPLGRFLSRHLDSYSDTDQILVLVTFTDKGDLNRYRAIDPAKIISERAIHRRALVRPSSRILDEEDYPVVQSYVDAVARHATRIRHVLKWFNGVSAFATKKQIQELRKLPMVSGLELIGQWKRIPIPPSQLEGKEPSLLRQPSGTLTLDYGTSFTQLNQINVPAVHNLGIYGQGVIIGVFDNGVRLENHQAFSSMNIIAQHDYVDHKTSVIPNNTNSDGISFGGHGTNTLSAIGGFTPGQLIGPAFKASFILARTENDSSETPIEEDNWAAGIQWAESLGVEVTSTSLGYLGFDTPYVSLTWQDMNGSTAIITNAADRAAGLGVVVLNSAGNSGYNASHNTLIAPADGDSVITVGAVTSAGARTSFSSVGPTTDNPPRIKPDVMAMGSGVILASGLSTTGYVFGSGTSYSCPLAAGVAALIRCANPSLTPMQVREAMRQTASQASSPDNLMGWGIINALAAINYYGIIPNGKIRGAVFNDYNGNGIRDTDEPGIAAVMIHCTGAIAESTLTDSNGNYLLDSLPIGSYAMSATLPLGFTLSTPAGGVDTAFVLFGADTSGFNFGGYSATGAIRGIVFHDLNNNGIRDSNETGIPNWKVRISGILHRETLTDSAGNYAFTSLLPGNYTVSESLLGTWAQTLPPGNTPYSVTISSITDTGGVQFGVISLPQFTYSLSNGWNLLSLPQDPPDHSVQLVYPGAISDAFVYNGSYQPTGTIPNSVGYWLRFSNPTLVTIDGTVRLSDTLSLSEGWNLIGSLSYPLAAGAIADSAGIIGSSIFQYNNGYTPTDTILPNWGYWVKASASGTIYLNANAPPRSHPQRPNVLPGDFNTLAFTDAAGHRQTLYFTTSKEAPSESFQYELPPPPPEGAFDVRYSSGRLAEVLPGHQTASVCPVRISSAVYPVTIEWTVKSKSSGATLSLDDQSIPLVGSGKLRLPKETGSLDLTLHSDMKPTKFALDQNFPNPFNPVTVITYQLPSDARVTLKVFDVTGREVRTLVDEQQDAGFKAVTFDAASLPSGVYFYRLNAGAYTNNKKMLLVK